jgi:hypothetical protein
MAWQDIVLTAGNYIFAIALLPSVFGPDKPALSSSLMTGSVLALFGVVYLSLGLVSSTFSVALTSFIWFVLAYQQWRRK